MELVRERQTIELTNAQAEKHNAQISERYRLLQNAENSQFAQEQPAQSAQPELTVETPTFVANDVCETPVVEQTPQVTDFVRERITSPVFTAEKFERTVDFQESAATAVTPLVTPVIEEIVKENTEVAAQYSLSALAKVVMAIFAAVVIALISLIAYNSQIINRKMIKIKDLESKREQLLDQQEEIQSRIAMAQSEESILQWAQSQGMVQIAN